MITRLTEVSTHMSVKVEPGLDVVKRTYSEDLSFMQVRATEGSNRTEGGISPARRDRQIGPYST